MSFIWFIALIITHAAAYAWGYDNGDPGLDREQYLELQKYAYDRFYEHERWKEERKAGHDLPNA